MHQDFANIGFTIGFITVDPFTLGELEHRTRVYMPACQADLMTEA